MTAIILNTMPKSASVYLFESLSRGLNRETRRITTRPPGNWPYDDIDEVKLAELVNIDGVTQQHFDAHPRNLEILQRLCPKLIVHVRDPRQSMVSWIHHCCSNHLSTVTARYRSLPFTQQVEYELDTFLRDAVQWLKRWLEVRDLNIHFATYEQFHADHQAYFRNVLDFYDIPLEDFDFTPQERSEASHFRKGEVDEWRRVLTDEQQQGANDMLSSELCERFGWSK